MRSKMTQFKAGETYRDPVSDYEYEVVEDVDTFGLPTHEAEYVTVRMRDDDGDIHGFDYEQVRDWPRTGTAADADDLSDDEKADIVDRAREDWHRLAREYDVTVDDVRQIINSAKSYN